MNTATELVITSDASGQLWNSCVWDHRVGTTMMVYKGGGASAPRTLCFLGDDYVISAESMKPLLHIWPLNSQEMIHQGLRTVLPGRVNALAVSPQGTYCIAGIGEKLHVWHMGSGRLLAVIARHFQKITCIKFTDDGSYFVSGGDDGMVIIWSLSTLIQIDGSDEEPRNIYSDHSLPVQDLHVGVGGIHTRLISVSSDRTCKVYDMASGFLLLSVIFNHPLTAVAADITGMSVYVGSTIGTIHCFELREPPRMREYHVESMDEKAQSFVGHTKAVTCLSTSLDGATLLSGSNDEKAMVWHIPSRQCLRILQHKAPVTNAFFIIPSKKMFAADLKPTVLLHSFQRGMSDDDSSNQNIRIMTKSKLHINMPVEHDMSYLQNNNYSDNIEESKIRHERDLYKKINYDLYKFTMKELLHKSVNGLHVEGDSEASTEKAAVDEGNKYTRESVIMATMFQGNKKKQHKMHKKGKDKMKDKKKFKIN